MEEPQIGAAGSGNKKGWNRPVPPFFYNTWSK